MSQSGRNSRQPPNINEILSNYYYDTREPTSYSSIRKLYKASKLEEPTIKLKDVAKWLLKQKTYVRHRYFKHHFKRNPIVSRHIDHTWNADLMDSPDPDENDSIRYILVVIDNLSKFGWAIPLINKTGPTIKKALFKLFRENRRKPIILATDAGKEFTNRPLKDFFNYRNIKHLIMKQGSKAVIAERWIRTLKEKIYKYRTYNRTNRYIDVLPNIVMSYNNSIHSRTKFKPIDVTQATETQVYRNLYKTRFPLQKSKINVGDKVRIALLREVFDKGYLPNYSSEIFNVYKVYYTSPFHKYRVKDRTGRIVRGSFYETQLIKIN